MDCYISVNPNVVFCFINNIGNNSNEQFGSGQQIWCCVPQTADFLELCSVTAEKNQYEKSEKSIKEY